VGTGDSCVCQSRSTGHISPQIPDSPAAFPESWKGHLCTMAGLLAPYRARKAKTPPGGSGAFFGEAGDRGPSASKIGLRTSEKVQRETQPG
jgi:hypothetical protein